MSAFGPTPLPLGAELHGSGILETLPLVHGSRGSNGFLLPGVFLLVVTKS